MLRPCLQQWQGLPCPAFLPPACLPAGSVSSPAAHLPIDAHAPQARQPVPGLSICLRCAGPLLLDFLPHLWPGEERAADQPAVQSSWRRQCNAGVLLVAGTRGDNGARPLLPPACPHPPQDWSPGEYVRWYIDGRMLYEVNKEALRAQTNSTGALRPSDFRSSSLAWEASWAVPAGARNAALPLTVYSAAACRCCRVHCGSALHSSRAHAHHLQPRHVQ